MFWLLSIISGICGSLILRFTLNISIPLMIVFYLVFQLGFMFLLFLFIIVLSLTVNKSKPIEKPSKLFDFVYKNIAVFVSQTARCKIIVSNKELFKKNRNYLIVCNHKSNMDPFLITATFYNRRIGFASKVPNFNYPFAGRVIHKCGFVPIDKEDNREALKSILQATKFVSQDKTYNYAIFPEGKRNFENNEVLDFKNGCLKIAQKAKIPVLVLTIHNTEKIKKRFPLKSTKIYIDILKVVEPEEFETKTCVDIGNEIRNLMLENVINFNNSEKSAQ